MTTFAAGIVIGLFAGSAVAFVILCCLSWGRQSREEEEE